MKIARTCLFILAILTSPIAALAADVAVLDETSGADTVVDNLNAVGHSASMVSQAQVTGGALIGYDVFIMGRNWCCDNHDVPYRDAVVSFVNGGGGLITEWDDYAFLFDGYDATFRYSDSLPQGEFISGDVGAGFSFGQDIPFVKAMDHPVWGPLPDNITFDGVDFPYTTYNADLSDWDVVATFTGDGTPNFPAQEFPMLIVGQTLPIVGMAFDWGDAADDPDVTGLYLRAVEYLAGTARPVPVPATSAWSLLLLLSVMMAIGVFYARRA